MVVHSTIKLSASLANIVLYITVGVHEMIISLRNYNIYYARENIKSGR